MITERRTSLRNDPAFVLAIVYTIAFVGMAFVMMLVPIKDENVSIAQQILSIMSIIQAGIVGYYYGSSKTMTDSQKSATTGSINVPVQPESSVDVKVDGKGQQ